MNGPPAQEWLNALLLLIQHAQRFLLHSWHALGFGGDIHGQPAWPWAHRVAGEMLLIDAGLARQVAWSLSALAFITLALVLALVWRRHRNILLGLAALVLLLAPWPAFELLFAPAVPTSFHRSDTRFSVNSIAQGGRVYARHCVACHGADGRGEGALAATLTRWPPTFVSPLLGRRADGELFWNIRYGMRDKEGLATMPAFSTQLSDADTWAVLDYIKALAAGTGASLYGNWPLPLPLPEVAVRCGGDAAPARGLAQWRGGQRVRVIALDGDPSSIPVDDVRFRTLLLTRDGKPPAQVPQFRSDCTAVSAQAWEVFARLAGVDLAALGGTQLLVDRGGWIRARAGGNEAWSDADMLCKSEQPLTTSASTAGDGLAVLLSRMDAEPVRFVKGGFVH